MVELLVAMAISSILLVGMVAASAFLQRYLETWQNRSGLAEELSYTLVTVSRHVEQCRSIRLGNRRIVIESENGSRTTIEWPAGMLLVNKKRMTASSCRIDSIGITEWPLSEPMSDTILSDSRGQSAPGIYHVTIIGSSGKGQIDTLWTTVRCSHEYFKYTP